jgi:hypothetical protein
MSSSIPPITPTDLPDADLECVAGGKEYALLALGPKNWRPMTDAEAAEYSRTHNMADDRFIFRRPP